MTELLPRRAILGIALVTPALAITSAAAAQSADTKANSIRLLGPSDLGVTPVRRAGRVVLLPEAGPLPFRATHLKTSSESPTEGVTEFLLWRHFLGEARWDSVTLTAARSSTQGDLLGSLTVTNGFDQSGDPYIKHALPRPLATGETVELDYLLTLAQAPKSGPLTALGVWASTGISSAQSNTTLSTMTPCFAVAPTGVSSSTPLRLLSQEPRAVLLSRATLPS